MNTKDDIRRIWKKFYMRFSSPMTIGWIGTCRHIVGVIDAPPIEMSIVERFRSILHLSLCQPCVNYQRGGVALRKAVRELIRVSEENQNLEDYNCGLVRKFSLGKE